MVGEGVTSRIGEATIVVATETKTTKATKTIKATKTTKAIRATKATKTTRATTELDARGVQALRLNRSLLHDRNIGLGFCAVLPAVRRRRNGPKLLQQSLVPLRPLSGISVLISVIIIARTL